MTLQGDHSPSVPSGSRRRLRTRTIAFVVPTGVAIGAPVYPIPASDHPLEIDAIKGRVRRSQAQGRAGPPPGLSASCPCVRTIVRRARR